MDQAVFQDEAPQNPPAIFPEQPPTLPPTHSAEQNHTTAALAATATAYNKDSTEPFTTTVARYEEQIDNGEEDSVRYSVGSLAKNQQLADMQSQQKGFLGIPYARDTAAKLKANIDQQVTLSGAPIDKNAVEKEGVKAVQSMGFADEKQASIASAHRPDVLDTMAQNVTKASIFNREIDGLQQAAQREGIGSKFLDIFSFPFQTLWAQHHSFGSGGFLPGTTVYRDVSQLWSLPVDQFAQQLPQVMQRVKDNSGVFGQNLGVTAQVMQNLGLAGVAVNAFNSDVWGAIDLASLPGGERALKAAASTVGLIRGVNRAGAIGTLADQILKDQMGLAETAGGTVNVHAPATTIGALIPEVATTKLINEATGLSGDLNRQLQNLADATPRTLNTLRSRTERLTPEQAQAAYETTAKNLAKRLQHDHILDVKNTKIVRLPDMIEARDEANKAAIQGEREIGTNKVYETVPDNSGMNRELSKDELQGQREIGTNKVYETVEDRTVGYREIARDDLQNVDEFGRVESVAFEETPAKEYPMEAAAIDIREEGRGGTDTTPVQYRQYSLHDKGGYLGDLDLSYDNTSKNIYVQSVTSHRMSKKISAQYDEDFEDDPWRANANALGPKAMRDLLNHLREQFPEAKTISGFRVSGARRKGNGAARAMMDIPEGPPPKKYDFRDLLAVDNFENEGGAVRKPTFQKVVTVYGKPLAKTHDVERMEGEGGVVPGYKKQAMEVSQEQAKTYGVDAMENEGGVSGGYKKQAMEVSEEQPKTYDIDRLEGEGGMNPRVAATQLRVYPPGMYEYGIDDTNGLRTVSALVGDPAGDGGYETVEEAWLGIIKRGWDIRDVNIVKVDNQFAIRVTQQVPETGVLTPAMKATDLPSTFHGYVFWKNANDMLHEMFAGPLIRQMHVASALEDRVAKPLQKNIQKLSRQSKKALEAVINLGNREDNPASQSGYGRWYNPNEFMEKFAKVKGRAPTDAEVVAYYSYKELYDWDYNIRNDYVHTSKSRQGWGTVSVAANPNTGFELPRVNGKLVFRPQFDQLTVYDAEEGEHIGAGMKSDELRKKWESGNYNLIQAETHFDLPNGDKGEYILAPKSGSTFGPLQRKQLPYVVGGLHRNYNAKFFVKQAVSQMLSPEAGGKEVWLSPLTHRAMVNGREAEAWASKQEAARVLYKKLVDETAAANKAGTAKKGGRVLTPQERMTFQQSDAGSFKKFHDLVKEGKINRDHPFESVYDKGLPSDMVKSDPNVGRWFNNEMPDYERELITNGRMYYSPQGEHLLDETGGLAPVLNPFKTLDRALNNAIKTKALNDYNVKVVEEWTRMARDAGLLDENSLGTDRSPQNAFNNGKLRITARGNQEMADAYQALDNMRKIHKRLLNYKTTDMAQADMAVRRFANWAEGKGGKFGDWAAAKAFDINDARPLAAMRAFVYDTTIGMFNPVRLWLHSMTAMAALTVHPVYGRAAGYMAPFMRLLDHNQSEALLDHIAGYGEAFTGFKPAEFKQMVKEYRRSGISTTGNDQIMLDASGVLRWASQLRDRGRIFMNMAEGYNRSVGWQIAWRKTIDEFPNLDRGSEEFLNKVHVMADDMTNNQTVASRSGWQTGFASTVTQFMQYQARMLERMLPKVLGGSERATWDMKVRLAAGQAVMYGAAGIPLAGSLLAVARDQYQKATGQDLDPDTWRTASKGAFDTLLYLSTGSDTDVADRAGIGAAWEHFFSDMANGRVESVLQFAGGPTGEILDAGYQNLNKIALYYRSQQVDKLGPEQFGLIAMDLTKFMQTMSTVQKEYWMLKTGWLQDQKTGQPIVQATLQDEMLVALGIPLRVERERFDYLNSEEDRMALARATGKTLSMFDRNAMAALQAGDDRGFTYWSQMASGIMTPFRDDSRLQQLIIQQAYQLDKSVNPEWDSMMMRYQKTTGIQQEYK